MMYDDDDDDDDDDGVYWADNTGAEGPGEAHPEDRGDAPGAPHPATRPRQW